MNAREHSSPVREMLAGIESDDDLAAFLERLARRVHEEEHGPKYVQRLRETFSRLGERHEFQAGQLVTWKPGLRNKMRPEDGAPVIVIETMPEPIYDETKDAGTTYFREPLDLVAGWLDGDGDLRFFYYDSRRLQPYEE